MLTDFKYSLSKTQHRKLNTTLLCDLSLGLITIHVSVCCWFNDINISQGAVATLRYGGIYLIITY